MTNLKDLLNDYTIEIINRVEDPDNDPETFKQEVEDAKEDFINQIIERLIG
jgi:Mg-chelatase subunit ChlI